MVGRFFALIGALACAFALSGCGEHLPGDATGAKVLRTILEKGGVKAQIVSFKKVNGRDVQRDTVKAYELMYESEILFPDGFEAKCADEKERGTCAILGIDDDRNFAKGQVHTGEGTLHFVKSDKGWMAEDGNTY